MKTLPVEAALGKLISSGMMHMCITPKMGILRPPKPLSIRNASEEAQYFGALRESNQRVEALRLQREHEFMAREPAYVTVIELEHVRCPLHLYQFKQSLSELRPGETLKLVSKAKTLVKDLKAACRILGIESRILRYRRQYYLYATQTSVHSAMVYPIREFSKDDEISSAGESVCVRHPPANARMVGGA